MRSKAAVKLHTPLDLRGNIPRFTDITHRRWNDVRVLDEPIPEAGAFTVMDRGYIDFARLYRSTRAGALFVIRAKKKFRFRRQNHRLRKNTPPSGIQRKRNRKLRPHEPQPIDSIPLTPGHYGYCLRYGAAQ